MTRHYTLTLSGSAQRLSALLSEDERGSLRALSLQPGGANVDPVYVGAAGLTTADYGFRLEAAESTVPPAPYILGEFDDGSSSLSEFYVLGTNGEKLHVFVVLYR